MKSYLQPRIREIPYFHFNGSKYFIVQLQFFYIIYYFCLLLHSVLYRILSSTIPILSWIDIPKNLYTNTLGVEYGAAREKSHKNNASCCRIWRKTFPVCFLPAMLTILGCVARRPAAGSSTPPGWVMNLMSFRCESDFIL